MPRYWNIIIKQKRADRLNQIDMNWRARYWNWCKLNGWKFGELVTVTRAVNLIPFPFHTVSIGGYLWVAFHNWHLLLTWYPHTQLHTTACFSLRSLWSPWLSCKYQGPKMEEMEGELEAQVWVSYDKSKLKQTGKTSFEINQMTFHGHTIWIHHSLWHCSSQTKVEAPVQLVSEVAFI